MNKEQVVYEKVTECMRTIFAFCLSRTKNREEAEDLSQEIVKEVLRSSSSLINDEAFYGWMWAIAHNVYKRYLRNRKKNEQIDMDENQIDSNCEMPEQSVVRKEELNNLRRELSLLSEHYRNATIIYYVDNKSCKHISQELEISLEMVKYLLFKSRKILREGMNMTREFGEKSYNPGVFNVDVWMDEMDYKLYYEMFHRRLPGNILLASYYNPMAAGEISMELGVSVPYLEDELKILMKHNLVKQLQNGRYQTNIIIFTQSCEEDVYSKTKDIYPAEADRLFKFIEENEQKIRDINFTGWDYPKNRLYWLATHITLMTAMFMVEEDMKNHEGFPLLSNGTHGYIWGTNCARENNMFNGIYGHDEDCDGINVCNFKLIQKCQEFHPRDYKVDILIKAAKVVQNHAPSQLSNICLPLSEIKYKMNAVGYIVEQMCTKGYLIVPNSPEKLGMYAVLK